MVSCSYILPFRRSAYGHPEMLELNEYCRLLVTAGCEVLVVDGSPAPVFSGNRLALTYASQHLPVDRQFGFLNDKVNAVHTGVRLASCERLIIGDDDIRYDPLSLGDILHGLDGAELVRPQNFLEPLPFWARMEAARMLINRGVLRAGDYPGTCAVRKSGMIRVGHYDGDVLFDNEEMIRHFAAHGAVIEYSLDLFVRKRPPTLRKWIEQRPRQAYEDFGLRLKTILFFALPLAFLLIGPSFGLTGLAIFLGAIALCSIILAGKGWMRGRARQYFPMSTIFFAPLWIIERSLSTYWALGWYLVRGGYPFGDRLLSKGIGRDWRKGARLSGRPVFREQ